MMSVYAKNETVSCVSRPHAETLEVISKPQIAFKSKAQLDEKTEHIQ